MADEARKAELLDLVAEIAGKRWRAYLSGQSDVGADAIRADSIAAVKSLSAAFDAYDTAVVAAKGDTVALESATRALEVACSDAIGPAVVAEMRALGDVAKLP